MSQWPDGDFAPQVLNRLDELDWQGIENTDNPVDFQEYLNRWPNGIYAPQARNRLVELNQCQELFWQSIVDSENPADFREYLNQWSAGTFAVRARDRIEELEFWESIADSESPANFQEYLNQWPSGTLAARARAQVEELEFWELIADSESPADFREYLNQWSAGTFAARARDRIADLEPPAPVPGRVFRDCPECPQMIVLPAGTFRMGSTDGNDNERPVRDVRVPAFALGRYEVTFGEWDACVESGACTDRIGDEGWGRGRRPVMNLRWEDAQNYVQWLARMTGQPYRLPSEAEWEYAARAGTTTRWSWGNEELQQCRYANGADRTRRLRLRNWPASVFVDCNDRHDYPAPVGSYTPNAFGLHDMLGNVWEMVADCWHDNYVGAPSDVTAWTRDGNCNQRPARGGSYLDDPNLLRTAARLRRGEYHDNRGFRVARALE